MKSIFTSERSLRRSIFKALPLIFMVGMLFFFSNVFSQSAINPAQGKNGGKPSSKSVSQITILSPVLWENGNAGGGDAHFNESHSVPYRIIMNNLTVGDYYILRIGFDVKDGGKMALDYPTYYRNYVPHGFFNLAPVPPSPPNLTNTHVAAGINDFGELVQPYDGVPGISMADRLQVNIPAPTYLTEPRGVNGTWTLLHDSLKKFSVFGASEITDIDYFNPDGGALPTVTIATSGTVKMGLMVRFRASKTTAIAAWGGHIAAQTDYGLGQSASSINGSPYHTRLITFKDGDDSEIFSQGSADRSLKTDAVYVAPPECPQLTKQFACPETNSITYTVPSQAGVTFNWAINANNTAGATLQNTTGASVVVIPSGTDFVPGGTFNLTLTLVKSGTPNVTCPEFTGIGEIRNVNVSATATSNQAIGNPPTVPGPGTTAYLDRAIGSTSQLTASGSSTSGATIASYDWYEVDDLSAPEQVLNNPNGSFDDATNNATPVYTVTANGNYYLKVIATDSDGCKDSAYVTLIVSTSIPPCTVRGPGSICPGTTNVYYYDAANDGADPIPPNFTAAWSIVADPAHPNALNNASIISNPTSTSNSVTVRSDAACNTWYKVKLVLTSTSGSVVIGDDEDCGRVVEVDDNVKPVLSGCPGPVTVDFCNIPAPAAVTATDNCPAANTVILVTFAEERSNGQNGCSNTITRTWTATDACGNTESCSQIITVVDRANPLITCPAAVTVACIDKDNLSKTGSPFTSDNCGVASVTKTDNPTNPTCGTTFVRTWRVTDNAGNSATCTQSITLLPAPSANLVSSNKTSGAVTDEAVSEVISQEKAEIQSVRSQAVTSSDLQVKAFPNPFGSEVNFSFVSPKSGTALLEIYDMVGRKLGIVYQGRLEGGILKTINYKVPVFKMVPMTYRLSINNQSARGTLLPSRKGSK